MDINFTQKEDEFQNMKRKNPSVADGPRITSAAVMGFEVYTEEEKKKYQKNSKLIAKNIKAMQNETKQETDIKQTNLNLNEEKPHSNNFNQNLIFQGGKFHNYAPQYNNDIIKNNLSNQGVYQINIQKNQNDPSYINAISKDIPGVTHKINSSIVNNCFDLKINQAHNFPTTTNNYTSNYLNTNFNQFIKNPNLQINPDSNNKNYIINRNIDNNHNVKIENLNGSSIIQNPNSSQSSILSQSNGILRATQGSCLRPEIGKKKGGKKAKKATQSKKCSVDLIHEIDRDDGIYFEEDDLNTSNINRSLNISRDTGQIKAIDCNFVSFESICVDNIANKVFSRYANCTQYSLENYCEDIIFREDASTKNHHAIKFSFCHNKYKTHIMYFNETTKEEIKNFERGEVYTVNCKRVYQVTAGEDGLIGIFVFFGRKFNYY